MFTVALGSHSSSVRLHRSSLPALCVSLLLFALAGCASAPRDSHIGPMGRYVLVTVENPATGVALRAGSTAKTYGFPSQYSVSPRARVLARTLAKRYRLATVEDWPIAALGVYCVVLEIQDERTVAQVMEQLRRDPLVESAQPLHTFATLGGAYDDPYIELQRGLPQMGLPQAHQYSRGRGVRIAIIDSAVDLQHPDLVGRRIENRDFTDRAAAPTEHGTAVAGVIVAASNNGLGIVGIAPEAQLFALNACWSVPGQSSRATCNSFTLAKALTAALDLEVDIVNLSLGGPSDPLLRRLVEHGLRQGIVFVGALPPEQVSPGFPCEIAGVIAVDSVGRVPGSSAALLAPGIDVLTLLPQARYDFQSGSSLAAAHATGGIALLLAQNRALTATEARELLASSAPEGQSINVCTALARSVEAVGC